MSRANKRELIVTEIAKLLLATQALEIAPAGKVFWYTSGTVGPFYLNAHFLYGGRKKAEELLAFIDQNSADRARLLNGLLAQVKKNYTADENYRAVIEAVAALAENEFGAPHIDYVSGGERRDWFFSLAVAQRLRKPALVLFKDQSALIFDEQDAADNRLQTPANLSGARVLHVADLVTEASSYARAWLPAIENRGGRLQWAINIVDRGQGGEGILAQHGVAARHLIQLGPDFFEELVAAGYLTQAAGRQLIAYHRQPRESMKKFLEEHPEILQQALQGEEAKIRQRARQMIEQNPYDFEENFLRRFGLL